MILMFVMSFFILIHEAMVSIISLMVSSVAFPLGSDRHRGPLYRT